MDEGLFVLRNGEGGKGQDGGDLKAVNRPGTWQSSNLTDRHNVLSSAHLSPNSIMQGRIYGLGTVVRW